MCRGYFCLLHRCVPYGDGDRALSKAGVRPMGESGRKLRYGDGRGVGRSSFVSGSYSVLGSELIRRQAWAVQRGKVSRSRRSPPTPAGPRYAESSRPKTFFLRPRIIALSLLVQDHFLERRRLEFPACFTATGWQRRRNADIMAPAPCAGRRFPYPSVRRRKAITSEGIWVTLKRMKSAAIRLTLKTLPGARTIPSRSPRCASSDASVARGSWHQR